MDPHSKTELEAIIKSVLRQEKSTKQAAKQITSLTTNEETNTPDEMQLLGRPDTYSIGMVSVGSINKNEYDGVVGVHVVGLQVTFYNTTLMAKSLIHSLSLSHTRFFCCPYCK